MSQIFGKVTNAVLSGTNENSFSLANLNLGFSLIKLEAPAEFHPLGSALSHQRRQTAEAGSYHQTARILGALFSHIAPSAPKLLRAFGQRVSEIIQSPGANPTGTFEDGPFKDSVGADATSIWAAATSGSASLTVLLLACLLARKFDDPKLSVAVWVEIVAIRQKEVLATAQSTGFAMNETVVAAHQRILREDLATFDASVRAWLITADQVMVKKLKQLRLILDNLTTLPVSVGKDTYAKIINAWERAISGFEALLEGKPQNATDSSVLLALSAWHLYPDLIVLSSETKKVVFQDSLFPPSVAITVGLSLRDNDQVSPGFQWSLALSHLRYYGEPVSVQTDHDNYRITMDELCLIAFGSLLAHWRLPNRIMIDVASWFCSLNTLLQNRYGDDLSDYQDKCIWLRPLFQASRLLVQRSEDESANFEKLVGYGRRRGKHIIGLARALGDSRFFGLCNPHVVHGLARPSVPEEYLHHVRSQTESLNIATFAVIQYWEEIAREDVLVLATATPLTSLPHQCSSAAEQQQQKVHARWIITDSSDVLAEFKRKLELERATFPEIIESIAPNKYAKLTEEYTGRVHNVHFPEGSFYLKSFPPKSTGVPRGFRTSLGTNYSVPQISSSRTKDATNEVGATLFSPVWGSRVLGHDIGLFAVYGDASLYHRQLDTFFSLQNANMAAQKPEETLRRVCLEKFPEERVARYFIHLAALALRSCTNPFLIGRVLCSQGAPSPATLKSLGYLGLMSKVYAKFPSATFPIKIVEKEFHSEEEWMDSRVRLMPLGRQEALQGICMMETGGVTISRAVFDRAFAIAAGNSIFVAESLLSDPSRSLPGHAIRRIVGNLGRPGVSILVSPDTMMVKEKTRDFRVVEHAPYDYSREDSFNATSLHLSLTEWKVPIAPLGNTVGNIDQDVFQVEAVVSVHDRGRWYGDIDVLGAFEEDVLVKESGECSCGSGQKISKHEYTSIDNFEELLDPPHGVGVFRAHKNWSARLAATCIARQTVGAQRVCILDDDAVCWGCLEGGIQKCRFERSFEVRLKRRALRNWDYESNSRFWEKESQEGEGREGESDLEEEDGCVLIIID